MNQITFVPVGGLANRMRSIASVITLAQQTKSYVNIIWFQDWTLHAPFHKLFEPINQPHITLKDASFLQYLSTDRPRIKNLYLPRFYQILTFNDAIYERSFYQLIQQEFNFKKWIEQNKHVYMASYSTFIPYRQAMLKELFVPTNNIQQKIKHRCKNFNESVIGVHIRRTDNIASIQKSPLNLFYNKIDIEIDKQTKTQIYLATDSEEVKYSMKKRYGNRIISSDNVADRSTVNGIIDGITDMYTLACTTKIYGSFQSSFSEIASQIGNIPLEIIQSDLA